MESNEKKGVAMLSEADEDSDGKKSEIHGTDDAAVINIPRKRSLNSDVPYDDNTKSKNLKKARYAWQVKSSIEKIAVHDDTGHKTESKGDYCSKDGAKTSALQEEIHDGNVSTESHSDMDWSNDTTTVKANTQQSEEEARSSNSNIRQMQPLSSSDNNNGSLSGHHSRSSQNQAYWKNEQLAKSIVDNAINKTLEELGLCPNSENNTVAQQQQLESHSLSAAINACGLHHQAINVWSSHNRTQSRTHNLAPIIAHLTRVSESITHNILQSRHLMEDSLRHRQHGPNCTAGLNQVTSEAPAMVICSQPSINDSQNVDHSDSSDSENDSFLADESMVISQNDLLTQAVSAAITEKGLSLGTPENLTD